jgi:hypothetical protein
MKEGIDAGNLDDRFEAQLLTRPFRHKSQCRYDASDAGADDDEHRVRHGFRIRREVRQRDEVV